MTELQYVLLSAALTWVMLMSASLMRSRAWTPSGLKLAFGNREDLPAPTPLTGRLERASRNMLENFLFFAAVVVIARDRGVDGAALALPCAVFFWARVAYFGAYAAGIIYLRTALWSVGVCAIAWIAWLAW